MAIEWTIEGNMDMDYVWHNGYDFRPEWGMSLVQGYRFSTKGDD